MQTEKTQAFQPRMVNAKPTLHSFDLKAHLAQLAAAPDKALHVKIGLQNAFTTALMQGACRTQPRVPEHLRPRPGQYKQIEEELHAIAPKDKHVMVLSSMPFLGGFRSVEVDFDRDILPYPKLTYPNYYLQPFHSLPGGWLNPLAMTGHRAAISALYRKAHRRGGEGLRESVAALAPRDAKVIYDFGASTSDQATFFLERAGADAKVHCVEASPYGHIVGRKLSADPRIEWHLTMIEDGQFEPNSADVVNIMFVLHECPDTAKRAILETAYKVLKPGGRLIVTEPPPEDLEVRSRGFFEPYRLQWLHWNLDHELSEAGFGAIEAHEILPPAYTMHRVAFKPRLAQA